MKRIVLILVILLFASTPVFALTVSFDLDETLIQSNHLDRNALKRAEELGYEIKTTESGQDYIVRPGAVDLLDFAKSLGFDLIIFTHNYHDYAREILDDSGLAKYFIDLRSHEDAVAAYNRDYVLYPNHRNITYPQSTIWQVYTINLYDGLIKNYFIKLMGNHNVQTFVPCYECAKYPPAYGARVHIDNSGDHVYDPVDFVGIKVEPFYADALEAKTANGDYVWEVKIKEDLLYLKRNGWSRLYNHKYGKEADTQEVKIAP